MENNDLSPVENLTYSEADQITQNGVKALFGDLMSDTSSDESDDDQGQPGANESKPVEQESKAEVEPEVKEEKQPETESTLKAPEHWDNETKEIFNSLDEKGKSIYLKHQKNLEAGYQRKFQELSEERKKTIAFQGLIERFEKDKQFAAHILSFKEPKPEDNNYGLGERPLDPYDAIKFDAMLEAKKAAHAEISKHQEMIERQNYQNEINKTIEEAKRDKFFPDVMKEMENYILSFPESLRVQVAETIDKDVPTFKQVYLQLREKFEKTSQAPVADNKIGMTKQPVAPLLESGGGSDQAVETTKPKSKSRPKDEAIKGNWDSYLSSMATKLFG